MMNSNNGPNNNNNNLESQPVSSNSNMFEGSNNTGAVTNTDTESISTKKHTVDSSESIMESLSDPKKFHECDFSGYLNSKNFSRKYLDYLDNIEKKRERETGRLFRHMKKQDGINEELSKGVVIKEPIAPTEKLKGIDKEIDKYMNILKNDVKPDWEETDSLSKIPGVEQDLIQMCTLKQSEVNFKNSILDKIGEAKHDAAVEHINAIIDRMGTLRTELIKDREKFLKKRGKYLDEYKDAYTRGIHGRLEDDDGNDPNVYKVPDPRPSPVQSDDEDNSDSGSNFGSGPISGSNNPTSNNPTSNNPTVPDSSAATGNNRSIFNEQLDIDLESLPTNDNNILDLLTLYLNYSYSFLTNYIYTYITNIDYAYYIFYYL